jgi:hypothetical protein
VKQRAAIAARAVSVGEQAGVGQQNESLVLSIPFSRQRISSKLPTQSTPLNTGQSFSAIGLSNLAFWVFTIAASAMNASTAAGSMERPATISSVMPVKAVISARVDGDEIWSLFETPWHSATRASRWRGIAVCRAIGDRSQLRIASQ